MPADGPAIAMSSRASSRAGKANITSTNRSTTTAAGFTPSAAMVPSTSATITPTAAAPRPIRSDSRAPHTMRV